MSCGTCATASLCSFSAGTIAYRHQFFFRLSGHGDSAEGEKSRLLQGAACAALRQLGPAIAR